MGWSRRRTLKKENERLRRAASDRTLDRQMLGGGSAGKRLSAVASGSALFGRFSESPGLPGARGSTARRGVMPHAVATTRAIWSRTGSSWPASKVVAAVAGSLRDAGWSVDDKRVERLGRLPPLGGLLTAAAPWPDRAACWRAMGSKDLLVNRSGGVSG